MEVRLSRYSEAWVEQFREEAGVLSTLLGDEALAFHHFGSTSVPGMMAKPVIDMMVEVREISRIDSFNASMEYSRFKEQLAERYTETRDYSPAKKAFVSALKAKALAWDAGR
ncbi:GrpB family protein [Paenibacillus herberti]|uniref:GrpB family protein n=1 Tax=Paenibacillus herberti TaxID=1619309 RepID=A0A229NY53_9BACL|nr:GrpB family protein [Paenibacillus herberti]OXM14843.1 hypothetical protein CGZ75_18425 [Paenibacillus herberti]